MELNPSQEKMLDALLEVSTTAEVLEKLISNFVDTIGPPFPEIPPDVAILGYYTKKELPAEKKSLVDELYNKHKK